MQHKQQKGLKYLHEGLVQHNKHHAWKEATANLY